MIPHIGLWLTSFGFAVPMRKAWQGGKRAMSVALGILTTTSVAYHARRHPWWHRVDLVVAHVVGGLYGLRSVACLVRRGSPADRRVFVGACASVWIFFGKSCHRDSPHADTWHMLLHGLSQWSWSHHLDAEAGGRQTICPNLKA